MGATQCVDTDFDVLFIDDVCSFLTPRLVTLLRQQGRVVVGVFDAADSPDAKRRLLECGITDVIESQAAAEEFLVVAAAATTDLGNPPAQPPPHARACRTIGVVGVVDGVGATEIAIALAQRVSGTSPAALVDLDPSWPSIAQRLDLPPHPNLRSLVDAALHGGAIDAAQHTIGSLRVTAGSAWQRSANPIPHHEITMALDALAETCQVMVADLGPEERAQGIVIKGFDTVILVASGDPIGLARLLKVRTHLETLLHPDQVLVVVNKTPRRRFYRAEIRSEVSWAMGGAPFALLPFDDGLVAAAWDGRPTPSGPFGKEVARIADLLVGAGAK
jgi:MinD-like ATPase involved in chromosome partitioning or flagellar assembly